MSKRVNNKRGKGKGGATKYNAQWWREIWRHVWNLRNKQNEWAKAQRIEDALKKMRSWQ